MSTGQNSFYERLKLPRSEFNISQKLVVDLMHEFELGVWKMLFMHLIRILHAVSSRPGTLTDILNARSAQLATAGGDMSIILS